jgi:hypothetical protein
MIGWVVRGAGEISLSSQKYHIRQSRSKNQKQEVSSIYSCTNGF